MNYRWIAAWMIFHAVKQTCFADAAADLFFTEQVKPLLEKRCYSCHNAEKQKGGLRLDSREAVLRGGENDPAAVVGKPEQSLLVHAVLHRKTELEMPPKEKLNATEIGLLERWVRDGLSWPAQVKLTAPAPVVVPTGEHVGDAWHDVRNPIVKIFKGERLDLWSLKPVERPELPKIRQSRWSRSGIDYFVMAGLEKAHLEPAPEADRRMLARRLYFDLTGLPPTPDQIESFIKDPSSRAYEHLVNELLDSPRYGEHRARFWMDIVRYSDSNGFDWDEFRKQAWRYRDYLIRSFNSDKPFNEFIREQLAGDETLAGPPINDAQRDALIATGFLRMGPFDNSAPLFGEQARSRAELLNDVTETTGAAFLGLSLSCCRCHDHKFDPISQADYYRTRAFFEGVKFADDLPLDLAPEQKVIRSYNILVDAELKKLRQSRSDLMAEVKQRLRDESASKLSEEERALLALDQTKESVEVRTKITAVRKKIEPEDKTVVAALSPTQKETYDRLERQIQDAAGLRKSYTTGLLMTDSPETPAVTHILEGGDYRKEGAAVLPGFLSILDPNAAEIHQGANTNTTGRRLTLANWIASPQNPLTARVIVNRIWQLHFGQGLVPTPNDFGLAGTAPLNQELLDWLADEFVKQGWSIKKLERMIVMSSTYRQSSFSRQRTIGRGTKNDPNNRLLWRQDLHRLTAEQLRDSMLSVSGMMRPHTGGPAVWPDLPTEVLQANPAFLDDNAEKTKGWYPSPPTERRVRSVFLIQKRTVRLPFMEAFDLPENSTSCPRRTESIVAPQAFTLLNNPEVIEMAAAFAARVERESDEDMDKQIRRAFLLAVQRFPTWTELNSAKRLANRRSLTDVCRVLINLNEFIFVD